MPRLDPRTSAAALLGAAALVGLLAVASPGGVRRSRAPSAGDADVAEPLPTLATVGESAQETPGAPGPEADLLRLLDTDMPRKDRIVRRIAALGGVDAWEGLAARLGDPGVRRAIEVALGGSAPPDVIDDLKRRLLMAPDAVARASVVRILAETADPRHGPDVRTLLDRETDADVRHAAIDALGRFGDAASADALLDLARHGGREARAALLALEEVGDEGTLQGIAARWQALDAEMRFALLHGTRDLERPTGALLAAAREALNDGDERVRLAGIDLLSRAGDDALEPLVDHAFRGLGVTETERTVRVLAGLGTPKAAEAGLRALDALSPRSQERYRGAFLAVLGR